MHHVVGLYEMRAYVTWGAYVTCAVIHEPRLTPSVGQQWPASPRLQSLQQCAWNRADDNSSVDPMEDQNAQRLDGETTGTRHPLARCDLSRSPRWAPLRVENGK